MSTKTIKTELDLETTPKTTQPTTKTKEVPMSTDINQLTEEEILKHLAERKVSKLREELLEEIKVISSAKVQEVWNFLNGGTGKKATKKASSSVPKGEKKIFSISQGMVCFGGAEVTETKRDKNGKLRIVKEGKGLPPAVEDQAEPFKSALLKLPVRA